MVGLAKSPSTRIVCKRLLGLRLVVLALLGSLILAGSASADATATESPPAATVAEGPEGASTPPAEETAATATPPPVEEAQANKTQPPHQKTKEDKKTLHRE